MGDHRELLNVEMIEQRVEVVRESAATGTAGHIAAQPEAAVIERHDAVALREHGNLLPPDEVVAARAVREHQRRRVVRAMAFVPEVDLVAAQKRHRAGAAQPDWAAASTISSARIAVSRLFPSRSSDQT